MLDEVEQFSADVTLWVRIDNRDAACGKRFWESEDGLTVEGGFDPDRDCAFDSTWSSEDPPPNRASATFLAEVRRLLEPLGVEVVGIASPQSAGRQIRAREVVVRSGGRADVREVLVNASRDLTSVAGAPSNFSLDTRTDVDASSLGDALARGAVVPSRTCGLTERRRGSDGHAAFEERVVEMARQFVEATTSAPPGS
ncbi:MAG: hypothetical protein AAGA54_14425 [Myxococcota bacterium]